MQTTGGGNNWNVYATFDGRTKTVYRNVNGTPQVKTCGGIHVFRSLSKDLSKNASGSKGDWPFNGHQHFSPYVAR